MEDYRNVIPLSHEIVMVAGNPFVIEKDTRILYLEDNILLERNTQFLAGYIKEATGRRLKVESGQDVNDKNMIICPIVIQLSQNYEDGSHLVKH